MDRTAVLEGLREMKFSTILGRWKSGELSQVEAAEVLGMTERTFRRWYVRFEEEGIVNSLPIVTPFSRRILTPLRARYLAYPRSA
jgi:hypothetical protein